jgi:hypothetical protein
MASRISDKRSPDGGRTANTLRRLNDSGRQLGFLFQDQREKCKPFAAWARQTLIYWTISPSADANASQAAPTTRRIAAKPNEPFANKP